MAHTRLRKFNTRDTYPEQKLDNDLCQAVITGRSIYLRGQVAQNLDTSVSVAVGDPAGQAEQVMRNIDQLLRECGASLEHICKVTQIQCLRAEPRIGDVLRGRRSRSGARICAARRHRGR
jgi:hypothetical protein